MEVFTEFMRKGMLDEVKLDADQTEVLVRLMDRVVIRLEGGSEADWLALEAEEAPPSAKKEDNDPPEEKPFVLQERYLRLSRSIESIIYKLVWFCTVCVTSALCDCNHLALS